MDVDEKIPPVSPAAEPSVTAPGRPFVKGQSGNPRGRPSRAHQAAWVGQYKIDRQTMTLVDDALMLAKGDKAILRECLNRLVPPRREAPVWLKVAPIEDRASARAALKAVATAVAQGDIPPAQGLKLVRIYTSLMRWL